MAGHDVCGNVTLYARKQRAITANTHEIDSALSLQLTSFTKILKQINAMTMLNRGNNAITILNRGNNATRNRKSRLPTLWNT
jgi:hypothetical protein